MLVLVAVGAALVLVAINRSSSDDFEEAGNIGIEGKCQTWEIHLATLEAAGHGGPEGHGGVFSSNIGCLAPCYWDITGYTDAGAIKTLWPTAIHVRTYNNPPSWYSHTSRLYYHDDNRPPTMDQYRLGVVYSRGGDRDHMANRNKSWMNPNYEGSEPFFRRTLPGVGTHPGTPLSSAWLFHRHLNKRLPTVTKPNWISYGPDPGNVLATNTGLTATSDHDELAKYTWEDEYWEVRADPGREVCEIVNVANDDLLVCSSAKEECEPADT